jgi:hypothetical protein
MKNKKMGYEKKKNVYRNKKSGKVKMRHWVNPNY